MDDLDRREAFLLAIFAAPDDDLPRLVFADYLDERGECEWAAQIRYECATPPPPGRPVSSNRGFSTNGVIACTVETLADAAEFRRSTLIHWPERYRNEYLTVTGGLIASAKPINTILHSPVTQRVARLDLSGSVVAGDGSRTDFADAYPLLDFEYRPTVTLQAVEALVGAREARRFTHLDLRNNDLDNDAARAIIRSPYLTRLESLQLSEGNQLRGRTWASLLDRFGEAVVS